jgi:V/A-type H+-transporting ATPase subunit K
MSETILRALCQGGAFSAIALAAVGSALGAGVAGSSAIGAWKKCYGQNKPAPFLLLAFVGAPLSQTIYGFLIMFFINGKIASATNLQMSENYPLFLFLGIFGGIALGVSAWLQGIAGAAAADAFAETDKGFANYMFVLGIVETVALFTLAFAIVLLKVVK